MLGPILYILYTNDIPDVIENNNNINDNDVTVYANDTNIHARTKTAHECTTNITETLSCLDEYFANMDLTMNEDKSNIMHFKLTYSNKNVTISENISTLLDRKLSSSTKFLGLTLDEKLTFEEHINNICKRLSTCTYALRTIRKHCSLEVAKTAYYGYFQSILSYGIIFWGAAADCYTHRAFILQKMVVRAICLTT